MSEETKDLLQRSKEWLGCLCLIVLPALLLVVLFVLSVDWLFKESQKLSLSYRLAFSVPFGLAALVAMMLDVRDAAPKNGGDGGGRVLPDWPWKEVFGGGLIICWFGLTVFMHRAIVDVFGVPGTTLPYALATTTGLYGTMLFSWTVFAFYLWRLASLSWENGFPWTAWRSVFVAFWIAFVLPFAAKNQSVAQVGLFFFFLFLLVLLCKSKSRINKIYEDFLEITKKSSIKCSWAILFSCLAGLLLMSVFLLSRTNPLAQSFILSVHAKPLERWKVETVLRAGLEFDFLEPAPCEKAKDVDVWKETNENKKYLEKDLGQRLALGGVMIEDERFLRWSGGLKSYPGHDSGKEKVNTWLKNNPRARFFPMTDELLTKDEGNPTYLLEMALANGKAESSFPILLAETLVLERPSDKNTLYPDFEMVECKMVSTRIEEDKAELLKKTEPKKKKRKQVKKKPPADSFPAGSSYGVDRERALCMEKCQK